MTVKSAIRLQIIALVLAAIAAVLCCVVAVKPEWVGITGLGEIRATPTAALVESTGFVAVGIFYLVMLVHAKTSAGTRAAVIISALLLCVLAVIVEPVLHAWENRQFIVQVPQIEDASTGTALLSAKLARKVSPAGAGSADPVCFRGALFPFDGQLLGQVCK